MELCLSNLPSPAGRAAAGCPHTFAAGGKWCVCVCAHIYGLVAANERLANCGPPSGGALIMNKQVIAEDTCGAKCVVQASERRRRRMVGMSNTRGEREESILIQMVTCTLDVNACSLSVDFPIHVFQNAGLKRSLCDVTSGTH